MRGMPGFGEILQKAVYLGVGLASLAGEKAGIKLAELKEEAQKLADELVKRGEMTAEEGRKFVDDLVNQAQAKSPSGPTENPSGNNMPRQIEISTDEDTEEVNRLRDRVKNLQDELKRLEIEGP